MSRSRLELQKYLEDLLGSRQIYFQPPASIQMKYPAIVYSLSNMNNIPANNSSYLVDKTYELILIDKNPDSVFLDKLIQSPFCRFSRQYTSDNLNHFVFNVTF